MVTARCRSARRRVRWLSPAVIGSALVALGLCAPMAARSTLAAAPRVAASLPARANDIETLRAGFAQPPMTARPWVIWFWFRNDVSREETSRELEEMAAAGIGGAEIRIIDDVVASDPAHVPEHRIPYLSEPWLDLLAHVCSEAERLGIDLAVHPGMGWRYGGPWVPPEDQSARLTLRQDVVAGERLLAGPLGVLDGVIPGVPASVRLLAWRIDTFGGGRTVMLSTFEDLSGRLEVRDRRYQLSWVVPPGDWLFVAAIVERVGAPDHVDPDSGGGGRSVDPFSRRAVRLQLEQVMDRIRSRLGSCFGRTLTEIATDSWEYDEVGVDWSPEIPAAFAATTGYDLIPRLHALAGYGPDLETVTADLARVKSDLLVRAFFAEMTGWAHRAGIRHRAQPYGEPAKDLFAAYRECDIPEVERLEPPEAIWVAHTCGKPLVSAEAFTFVGDFSPGQLRRRASRFYAFGVNRLDIHSFSYSPPEAGSPGWRMYVPIHLNRTTDWWPQAPRLLAWMARSQWLLQAGRPVAEVTSLGLAPPPDGGAPLGWDRLSPQTFACLARSVPERSDEPGQLVFDPGALTLDDIEVVDDLIADGNRLLCTADPCRFPALEDIGRKERKRGNRLRARLERYRRREFLLTAADPWSWLAARRTVRIEPAGSGLELARRRLGDEGEPADILLVTNPAEEAVRARVGVRDAERVPERWDPDDGSIAAAGRYRRAEGWLEIPVELGPGASEFWVLAPGAELLHALVGEAGDETRGGPGADEATGDEADAGEAIEVGWEPDGYLYAYPERSGCFELALSDGSTRTLVAEVPDSLRIDGTWPVVPLEPGRTGGRVVCRIDVELAGEIVAEDLRVSLDLAPIGGVAEVTVNRVPVGTSWYPPFVLDVTRALRPGPNRIELVLPDWPGACRGRADGTPCTMSGRVWLRPGGRLRLGPGETAAVSAPALTVGRGADSG